MSSYDKAGGYLGTGSVKQIARTLQHFAAFARGTTDVSLYLRLLQLVLDEKMAIAKIGVQQRARYGVSIEGRGTHNFGALGSGVVHYRSYMVWHELKFARGPISLTLCRHVPQSSPRRGLAIRCHME